MRHGQGRDHRRRRDRRQHRLPSGRGGRTRRRAPGPRRARRRLHLQGRGRCPGTVLRPDQHRAGRPQPGRFRAVRRAPGAGDRPAPGRLPVPAVDARGRDVVRGRRAPPERAGRRQPHDRRRRGEGAVPADRHRRAAGGRLVTGRRALHPGVGGARLRDRRPAARRDGADRGHGHRHRHGRRRGPYGAHRPRPDRRRRGDLRGRRLVRGDRRDGRRGPAGHPAAPADHLHRADAGADRGRAVHHRFRVDLLLPPGGPWSADGHVRPGRGARLPPRVLRRVAAPLRRGDGPPGAGPARRRPVRRVGRAVRGEPRPQRDHRPVRELSSTPPASPATASCRRPRSAR
ncbi:hypothetical protein SAMN05421541_106407 [Actinoplanes philippinensis]|uniref:Uncharacterized protein n=1 Tax=Actinoplanes philippinensis TaxID=35752 RepID=A0A1I2GD61_9ACTN|nr:hypothetical protein SAMN05421541_106407 [Actinoplanes philippinensis]